MTTARSLIQSAFREGNLIDANAVPTDNELAEGLEKLNRYIRGVFGFEMGEPLADWLVPAPQRTAAVAANYPQMPFPLDASAGLMSIPYSADLSAQVYRYPPKNSRIVWGQTGESCWFPEQPDDGCRMGFVIGSGERGGDNAAQLTIDGNGKLIGTQSSVTLTTASPAMEWMYRADLGVWKPLVNMALDDDCLFPFELDDLWICALAIRLAPSFEKKVHPVTQATFSAMLSKLKARYRQAGTTTYNSNDIPRSLQSSISGRWWY